jgi:hypothetical protein
MSSTSHHLHRISCSLQFLDALGYTISSTTTCSTQLEMQNLHHHLHHLLLVPGVPLIELVAPAPPTVGAPGRSIQNLLVVSDLLLHLLLHYWWKSVPPGLPCDGLTGGVFPASTRVEYY